MQKAQYLLAWGHSVGIRRGTWLTRRARDCSELDEPGSGRGSVEQEGRAALTQLMGQRVGRLEPLVLDHRAALAGVTDGANVRHAQGVAHPLLPTEVLRGGEGESMRTDRGRLPIPAPPESKDIF